MVERHDAIRIGDGERTEQQRVHDAEDGGVGADAQGKRRDGDGGEGGRAPQRAHGVAHVLRERLNQGPRPCVAHLRLDLLGAAELDARGPPGRPRFHAAGDVLVFEQVEVGPQFVVERLLDAGAPDEVSDEAASPGEQAHLRSP